MEKFEAIIIGGGPCGIAAYLALKNKGISALIIEKGNIVHTLSRFPTHQTFFSTSEKLEVGNIPFIIEGRKPKKHQALAYYRDVVKRNNINIHSFEEVKKVTNQQNFVIESVTAGGQEKRYEANAVIVATGYYDQPNYLSVPGEQLDKVSHYFFEGHKHFNQKVVVIGGKNSSVDAALELEKCGAEVTVLYRGNAYSPSIKPWVLPEFEALVRSEEIKMEFNANIIEIKEKSVVYEQNGKQFEIENDYVFAMTGYHPDHTLIKSMGVKVDDETGRPLFNPDSMETNIEGIYIAGVIAAGNNANEIFIENGRFHGDLIANHLSTKFV
ncbi:YpdA family putative bacillithiol disulfide reductase [Gottfriedia luciferensis]|uniref:YpdA family putative bacillithiol disulfide reductase n=1 Tax=Gottfriedia luciferensis TaxID=178774 RepID=UPI000B44491E|nr:YpdA family putative bacillithiol disulfide reductase [Gottfriedia luciferensis]